MKTAQELYEGIKIKDKTTGLITYMRTDSIRLSPAFINICKEFIKENMVKNLLELLRLTLARIMSKMPMKVLDRQILI